jgi:hypothetical protein
MAEADDRLRLLTFRPGNKKEREKKDLGFHYPLQGHNLNDLKTSYS